MTFGFKPDVFSLAKFFLRDHRSKVPPGARGPSTVQSCPETPWSDSANIIANIVCNMIAYESYAVGNTGGALD